MSSSLGTRTFWGTATALALTTALISGTNNFLTKIAVKALKDPIAFTTLKNGLVALFLIGLIVALGKRREIASLRPRQWGLLGAIGLIGGSVPFAMFFTGLTMTPAVNAAFIHKTLFIWVMLLAVPLLRERVTPLQLTGVAAIFGANLLIGGFNGFEFSKGELLILGATLLWAVENIIAKVTLKTVSSLTVAAARMTIGTGALAVFLLATGRFPALGAITPVQWAWTALTSALLLGYVVTWYSALKRAPATYVATLLVPAVLVTNVLSAIFITHTLQVKVMISAGLFALGTALVIFFTERAATAATAPEQAMQAR